MHVRVHTDEAGAQMDSTVCTESLSDVGYLDRLLSSITVSLDLWSVRIFANGTGNGEYNPQVFWL